MAGFALFDVSLFSVIRITDSPEGATKEQTAAGQISLTTKGTEDHEGNYGSECSFLCDFVSLVGVTFLDGLFWKVARAKPAVQDRMRAQIILR